MKLFITSSLLISIGGLAFGQSVERVSVGYDGSEANGRSGFFLGTTYYNRPFFGRPALAISDDGTQVAFSSLATNLVPNDTNGFRDVFVRNLKTSTTVRLSHSASGVQGDANSGTWSWNNEENGICESLGMSGDGRYVVFSSLASNLIDGSPLTSTTTSQVYVVDRDADADGVFDNSAVAIRRLPLNNGYFPATAMPLWPSLTRYGNVVSYWSPGHEIGALRFTDGIGGPLQEWWPFTPSTTGTTVNVAFSRDGMRLAESYTTPSASGLALRERGSTGVWGVLSGIVSPYPSSVQSLDLESSGASVVGTRNGNASVFRFVGLNAVLGGWSSYADSLTTISPNGRYVANPQGIYAGATQIYVVDRDVDQNGIRDEGNDVTNLISSNLSGAVADASSGSPVMSRNNVVAFMSDATDLISGDTNGTTDIFVSRLVRDIPVHVELSLLVDISGSVDDNEYAAMLSGIASVIEDATVVPRNGSIAFDMLMFASSNGIVLPWRLIDSESAAASTAAEIRALINNRPNFGPYTHLLSGLKAAASLFEGNSYEGTNRVIFVVGDGCDTEVQTPQELLDAQPALFQKCTRIDGLSISADPDEFGCGELTLKDYYAAYVAGPVGVGICSDSLGFCLTRSFGNTLTTSLCGADFNEDGTLDSADSLAFQAAFSVGSAKCDYNGDGVVDSLDSSLYDYVYFVGCDVACSADVNYDQVVDLSDFFFFFNVFEGDFSDPNAFRCDLNDDCVVDLNDYFLFFTAFDGGC